MKGQQGRMDGTAGHGTARARRSPAGPAAVRGGGAWAPSEMMAARGRRCVRRRRGPATPGALPCRYPTWRVYQCISVSTRPAVGPCRASPGETWRRTGDHVRARTRRARRRRRRARRRAARRHVLAVVPGVPRRRQAPVPPRPGAPSAPRRASSRRPWGVAVAGDGSRRPTRQPPGAVPTITDGTFLRSFGPPSPTGPPSGPPGSTWTSGIDHVTDADDTSSCASPRRDRPDGPFADHCAEAASTTPRGRRRTGAAAYVADGGTVGSEEVTPMAPSCRLRHHG